MTHSLVEIRPDQLQDNAFQAISQQWMLITAGALASFNTMTANWGAWGHLWNRDVCFCFVRPQRHTFGFMERSAHFTLSFFDEAYRPALDFCGSHSGREVDKIAATGLTPVAGLTAAVYFAQARLVFECRKLYAQDVTPGSFVDPAIPTQVYGKGDYHRMYVGEIVRCLVNREPGT
ncbi:MAG: flavin reductase family protein [Chloroflexi bacterium]|nr:flavin reductase family protein [Chloroflexota bacterium]